MQRIRGFTLVELLLVVVILGLLAAVALPRLAHTGSQSKQNTCKANIRTINSQIELWTADNSGTYPPNHGQFLVNILNNPDVFPDGAPQCPYGDNYVYDPVPKRVIPHAH